MVLASGEGASATDDYYNGGIVVVRLASDDLTSNYSNTGIARRITDYVAATRTLTVSPALPSLPVGGKVYTILPSSPEMSSSGAGISVDDILDALTADHLTAGTVGKAIADGALALQPTIAGRTVDVTTTGEVGIDLANVGSPTATLNLSGTTVKTATDVETKVTNVQTRLPAALDGSGNMMAGVQSLVTGALSSITAAIAAKVVTVGGQTMGGILGHVAMALWGKRTGQNGPTLTVFNDHATTPVAEIVQAVAIGGATASPPTTLNNP